MLTVTTDSKTIMKIDYTVWCGIALKDVKVELRKHFDKTYSVVVIDKVGNEAQHIRTIYAAAAARYEVEKAKINL